MGAAGADCRAWRTVFQGGTTFEDMQRTAENVTRALYNTKFDLHRTIVQLGDVITSCASSNCGWRSKKPIDLILDPPRPCSGPPQHNHASCIHRKATLLQ
jgi:hypothetical protein